MERLLRWGIQNSDTTAPPAHSATPLDPGIIDAILGKPDSELMKEDLQVALDATKSEEQRVEALDHLEMLIEQIDNANDLERLGLWGQLQSLLLSENTPRSVILHALWVIGTALQNNPAAQDAYMKLDPLPPLLSFSTPSPKSDIKIRSKVVYTLSGLLKHNSPAVGRLDDQGWKVIKEALRDPDIQTRRKTVFLLNTLLIPSEHTSTTASDGSSMATHTPDTRPASSSTPVHPNSHADLAASPSRADTSTPTRKAMQEHKIISRLISELVDPVPHGEDGDVDRLDEEFEETAIRVIHTFAVSCGQPLTQEDKDTLSPWVKAKYQQHGAASLCTSWAMSSQELEDFVKIFTV